ncbi:MAG: hypothetical protein OXB84_05565 [Halobacteriovoraceae bacterium]|nr:hypothetical protein [Halobacteriovoraceae bacterium]
MSIGVGNYNQRIANTKDRFDKTVNEIRKNHKKHLENYKEASEKKRAKNVEQFKDELQENSRILNKKMKKVNEEFLHALDKRDDAYNKKLEAFKKWIHKDRKKSKKKFHDSLNRISGSFRESLKSNDIRNESIQKEIKKRLHHIIDRDRLDYRKDLDLLRDNFKYKNRQQRDKFTKQTRGLVKEQQAMEDRFLYQQTQADQERRVRFNKDVEEFRRAHKHEADLLKESLLRMRNKVPFRDDIPIKNMKDNYEHKLKYLDRGYDNNVKNMR